MKYKIGVFDSGVGGLSVAKAIEQALPKHTVLFVNDKEHVPYGDKPLEEIYGYTITILKQLVDDGCDVIVIACNTVTTNFIQRLRQELPVPLIGIEPMVKPAAEWTKSGVIAVCATPNTLASPGYQALKSKFAAGIAVLEPDCSNWSQMIESEKVDHDALRDLVNNVCEAGADVIVLACTHYHWIHEELLHLADDRADVIQPEQAIVARLKTVLKELV